MAEMTHSRLGASSCKRWLNCPGSVNLISSLPEDNSSSIYAAEGTCAHELGEFFLKNMIDAKNVYSYVGEVREVDNFEITITEEMADAVYLYVNTVREDFANTPGGLLYVEQNFTISSIDAELSGTNDAMIYDPENNILRVYDLKYGKGVPVEVEGNEQLMFYALGACSYLKESGKIKHTWVRAFEKVELVIIQPRCPHVDGAVRRWDAFSTMETAHDSLAPFYASLAEGIKKVRGENPELSGGSHCRWCRAKTICSAFKNKVNEGAQMDFAPVSAEPKVLAPPKVDTLTVDQISKILELTPMVEEFIKEVQDKATSYLHQGLEVPGFKLVQKRANRKWIDEEDVAAHLGDVVYTKKIKTPAQLEKELGKEAIQDYIMVPDAGFTIVPESDKRQAVIPVQQSFDCIEPPVISTMDI